MRISSPAFQNNERIPLKYTCEGDNINPPLVFADVPRNSKSLALIMEDPDVPTSLRADGMWDHWVLYNINSDTREIPEKNLQIGTLGKNTS